MRNYKANLVTVILIILSLVNFSDAGVSRAQLAKSSQLMRNVCQPKVKVEDEKIIHIKDGEFLDDPDVKCYINCVLQMSQLMKNGKLNYDFAVKQAEMMLPEPIKSSMVKSLDECKNVSDKIKDPCEAAFQVAKCVYNADPENFIFP